MNELEKYKEAVSTGSDFVGSISGGILGALLAGPAGAAIGSAAGTGIGKIINKIGSEIAERTLSKRENIRIGACTAYAADKINDFTNKGFKLRSEFIDEMNNGKATELLEAIYFKSKEAYEEKKVRHLGNFFANVAFHEEISFEESFHLISIFEKITWEQILILRAFYLNNSSYWGENSNRSASSREWAILSQLNELINKNLLMQKTEKGEMELYWGLGAIKPGKIRFTSLGLLFCNFFSINEIDIIDVEYLIRYFTTMSI